MRSSTEQPNLALTIVHAVVWIVFILAVCTPVFGVVHCVPHSTQEDHE